MSASSNGRGKRRPRKPAVTLFMDRSLGKSLPLAVGLLPRVKVVRLHNVFGNDGQHVEDVTWLAEAGAKGWPVFTQDARVWKNLDERAALLEHGVRVFCLGMQQSTNAQKGIVYGRHILPILRRAQKPGPCFWRLYPERVDKVLR